MNCLSSALAEDACMTTCLDEPDDTCAIIIRLCKVKRFSMISLLNVLIFAGLLHTGIYNLTNCIDYT